MQYQSTLAVILALLLSTSLFGQTEKKDVVFNWKYSQDLMWIPIDSSFQAFTPSLDEIQLAKELSVKHIDSLQSEKNKQRDTTNVTLLNYGHNEYLRQYLGYIDGKGNKIILINACCSENCSDINLERHWIFAMDGGSCYFLIKVNLENGKSFGLEINGDS